MKKTRRNKIEYIDKLMQLKCPQCNQASFAKYWDQSTLDLFSNRQSRRRFKSILASGSRNRGAKRVYVCPICKSVVEGYMINEI